MKGARADLFFGKSFSHLKRTTLLWSLQLVANATA
jgi:hypothetical protein